MTFEASMRMCRTGNTETEKVSIPDNYSVTIVYSKLNEQQIVRINRIWATLNNELHLLDEES